jgi:hypothetical protein
VPQGQSGAFLSFSYAFDYPARPLDKSGQPLYLLSDYEYVFMLLDATDLLQDREPGGIAVFDSVNALPFMLGVAPTRGENLWSTWSAPMRSADEYLADVRYILVPKFSTLPQWTEDLMRLHAGYLEKHFRQAAESRCWILLTRSSPDQPTSARPGQI